MTTHAMDPNRLDHLERLQKLRESGALEDDEFQIEKRKLLANDPRREVSWPRNWFYGILAVAALSAVIGLGFWAAQNEQVATPKTTLPVRSPAPIIPAPDQPAVYVESVAERLADAFEAATGHRSVFSEIDGSDVVTTKPIRIIQLPFGPALLTKRETKDGCHACTGAIGVFYLKEGPDGGLKVIGRWPKAVEGWGWGAAPTKWYVTNKFTAYPAIYASGGFMGQGIVEESATITELSPGGPVTSDVIGTSYSDEGAIVDNERQPCVVNGTVANVRKDRSFDVVARGSVNSVDHYLKKGGKFIAASNLDWSLPCNKDPFRD